MWPAQSGGPEGKLELLVEVRIVRPVLDLDVEGERPCPLHEFVEPSQPVAIPQLEMLQGLPRVLDQRRASQDGVVREHEGSVGGRTHVDLGHRGVVSCGEDPFNGVLREAGRVAAVADDDGRRTFAGMARSDTGQHLVNLFP